MITFTFCLIAIAILSMFVLGIVASAVENSDIPGLIVFVIMGWFVFYADANIISWLVVTKEILS